MSVPELIPVRLTANYRVYNAGEVAGFPPSEAADLIARQLAEPHGVSAASEGDVDDALAEAKDVPTEAKGGKKK